MEEIVSKKNPEENYGNYEKEVEALFRMLSFRPIQEVTTDKLDDILYKLCACAVMLAYLIRFRLISDE